MPFPPFNGVHTSTFVLKAVGAWDALSKASISLRTRDRPTELWLGLTAAPCSPSLPSPRIDVPGSGQPASQSRYRNWNPPLLGNLPDDFLRILPQQMDSIQVTSCPQTCLPACLSSVSSGLCTQCQPRLLPGFQGQAELLLLNRVYKEREMNPWPCFSTGPMVPVGPREGGGLGRLSGCSHHLRLEGGKWGNS